MATLRRRRAAGADDADPSNGAADSASTAGSIHDGDLSQHRAEPVTHAHPHGAHKRRSTLMFLLGGLVGIIIAGILAQRNDLIDLPEFGDISIESFKLFEVLPAGLVKDMKELTKKERDVVDYDSFAVGIKARSEGLYVHHPVIMIPGVISTGLESWSVANISRPYFRKRLWGSWTMMRALVMDKENWRRHLMLDKITGLDPPNIKLRAAQGFDATDFFITGYWIWNKIVENLASLGYDPTNSFTAAYDWRLSYINLETRDSYFSRLKSYIEIAYTSTGKKAVLISHSMGGQVVFFFFHWVASPLGGGGGDDWVEKYVEAWINISGCMLGALKDVPAMLSGEMRDTAQLSNFAVYGLDRFLSKEERADLFRAMPGMSSMLPKGGERVWGNLTWAPDDEPNQTHSFGSFLNFREAGNCTTPNKNFTVTDAMQYLMNTTENWYQDQVKGSYSHGIADTAAEVEANEKDPRKWVNPLETRLPRAPSLKIYCWYGVGNPTERAFFYKAPDVPSQTHLNITIDTALTQDDVDHGVVLGEGDGTVNLLSAGYMCSRGWNIKRYNPAGVKISVHEMLHDPDKYSPRGGPNTAHHVDILGRHNLNELVLRVAAGKGDAVPENVISKINVIANKVKIYEEGEEPHGAIADDETVDA